MFFVSIAMFLILLAWSIVFGYFTVSLSKRFYKNKTLSDEEMVGLFLGACLFLLTFGMVLDVIVGVFK